MRKLIPLVFLAGCALSPDRAAYMSSAELCRIARAPLASDSRRDTAMYELAARRENCHAYESNQEAGLRQMEAGMELLKQSQPQPQPTPTNCRTVYGNGVARTTCF